MPGEDRINEIEKVVKDFSDTIAFLTREYKEKIRKILREIDEQKIAQLKKNIQ